MDFRSSIDFTSEISFLGLIWSRLRCSLKSHVIRVYMLPLFPTILLSYSQRSVSGKVEIYYSVSEAFIILAKYVIKDSVVEGIPRLRVLFVSRPLFGIVSVLVVYLQDVLNSLLTFASSDVSGKYQTLRVIFEPFHSAKRSVFNLPWLVKETNQRSQLNRFIRNIGFVLHRSRLAIGIPNTNIWLSQRKVLLLCIFVDSIVNSNEP